MEEPTSGLPEARAKAARAASLLALLSLAVGGLAASVDAAGEGGSGFEVALTIATLTAFLVLGGARVPRVDERAELVRAGLRVALALLPLVLGHVEGPLGFHVVPRAVAQAAHAAAVIFALVSLGATASPERRARAGQRLEALRADRLLVLAGVATAAALVASSWLSAAGEPLAPDAIAFREIASRPWSHPYDTSFREPLHVWVLRLTFALLGSSDAVVRGLSVFLYALALAAYYVTSRSLFGRAFAAVAFFLFSISSFNARMAVLGLRNEELVIFLSLLVLAGRRAVAGEGSARAALAAGLAAGAAALTYASLFLTAELWLLLTLAGARARARLYPLALLPPLLLFLPHLANNRREYGDPFHTINLHARFYRNIELAGRPGFPTREEVAKDSYAGPPTTPLRYMFQDHAPGEAAAIFARGAARLAAFRSPAFDGYRPHELGFAVWFLAVAGALATVLVARDRLFVPLLIVLGTGPIVFVTGAWIAIEPRLTNQLLFAWLWLLGGLAGRARR